MLFNLRKQEVLIRQERDQLVEAVIDENCDVLILCTLTTLKERILSGLYIVLQADSLSLPTHRLSVKQYI